MFHKTCLADVWNYKRYEGINPSLLYISRGHGDSLWLIYADGAKKMFSRKRTKKK